MKAGVRIIRQPGRSQHRYDEVYIWKKIMRDTACTQAREHKKYLN